MISPIKNFSWSFVLLFLIFISPFFFFAIGMPFGEIASDASTYAGYGASIAKGLGYTYNNLAFTNMREPGYPLFIALVFMVFGVSNYVSVYIIQSLLLGLLGLIVYFIFKRLNHHKMGYIAGFLTTLLPSYGFYSHVLGTELFFAFFIGLIFYVIIRTIQEKDIYTYRQYAFIGLLFGIASLIRVQLLLCLPGLLILFILVYRKDIPKIYIKSLTALLALVIVIGLWVNYVHIKTGRYSITEGRQELALYTRAVRAQLSYKDQNKYAYLWVKRSLTGGEFNDFLYANEYNKIGLDYWAMATSTQAVARVKDQSLNILNHNIGHFLYGNIIEAIKTVYIEHDYSDVLNKYVRAGTYLLIYGIFIIGSILFFISKKKKSLLSTAYLLAVIMIAYNISVLSFFDSIPRYNTPYLFVYIIAGFSGIALYSENRKEKIS